MSNKQIEPSLLAFDKEKIPEQLQAVKNLGIKTIHYDVMDEYVNNTSYDNEWIEPILELELAVNVHLMVKEPILWIQRFCQFPIHTLTFQLEALTNREDVLNCLKAIKNFGVKAGIAIKPDTSSSVYVDVLPAVDVVTIMTVEPGKGGQSFMPSGLRNLKFANEFRTQNDLAYIIEVDGGIKIDNYQLVIADTDYLISGTGFMCLDTEKQKAFIQSVNDYQGEENEKTDS